MEQQLKLSFRELSFLSDEYKNEMMEIIKTKNKKHKFIFDYYFHKITLYIKTNSYKIKYQHKTSEYDCNDELSF